MSKTNSNKIFKETNSVGNLKNLHTEFKLTNRTIEDGGDNILVSDPIRYDVNISQRLNAIYNGDAHSNGFENSLNVTVDDIISKTSSDEVRGTTIIHNAVANSYIKVKGTTVSFAYRGLSSNNQPIDDTYFPAKSLSNSEMSVDTSDGTLNRVVAKLPDYNFSQYSNGEFIYYDSKYIVYESVFAGVTQMGSGFDALYVLNFSNVKGERLDLTSLKIGNGDSQILGGNYFSPNVNAYRYSSYTNMTYIGNLNSPVCVPTFDLRWESDVNFSMNYVDFGDYALILKECAGNIYSPNEDKPGIITVRFIRKFVLDEDVRYFPIVVANSGLSSNTVLLTIGDNSPTNKYRNKGFNMINACDTYQSNFIMDFSSGLAFLPPEIHDGARDYNLKGIPIYLTTYGWYDKIKDKLSMIKNLRANEDITFILK